MEGKNINLMPKESRGSEKDTTPKTKVDDFQPQLVIPKKEEVLVKIPKIKETKNGTGKCEKKIQKNRDFKFKINNMKSQISGTNI